MDLCNQLCLSQCPFCVAKTLTLDMSHILQGSKFPPVRLPGASRFSVRQPKMLTPLALWASWFWIQLLVKRCQPKAMISFSSTVGLVSCKPTPFQPFLSHFHLLHPPQLCRLTEKAKLSRSGAWQPHAHSMVSLAIIDLDVNIKFSSRSARRMGWGVVLSVLACSATSLRYTLDLFLIHMCPTTCLCSSLVFQVLKIKNLQVYHQERGHQML